VLVVVDRSADERPIEPDVPPIEGTTAQIAAALLELADAGADEIIIVASPIDERSIRRLGEVVASIRG
jgi:alkanesulfonate monooxygenase SsuD/methylene tetrahydromethanopterin reductase-like flavin-dependent oxidoreductase (luciferase family)